MQQMVQCFHCSNEIAADGDAQEFFSLQNVILTSCTLRQFDKLLMFLPWAATKWFTHDLRSDDGVASGSSYPQKLDGFAFGNLMFVPLMTVFKIFQLALVQLREQM